jgi:predicted GNAT family N-acyltransferase
MKPGAFRIVDADYERDVAMLRAIREPVFVQEQNVPLDMEWDELDPLSRHVLALDADGQPIGTGRLTPEQRIGRMAVLPDWRGRGIGEAMLRRLVDIARELGYADIELHAQVSAIGFYERNGFAAYGEEFEEAGIQHRHMRRALQAGS